MALHISLSLGLACLFTPAFTSALNPLPPHLYSHGSATLTTMQQVAGAAGTALLIAIMAGRTLSLRGQGVAELEATGQGLNTSFAVAGGIGIIAIVLAAFMRKQETPAGGAHGGHGGVDEDGVEAEEAGAELR
jgi:DHA2 family lincomycin resistance protein-like MFS transporter